MHFLRISWYPSLPLLSDFGLVVRRCHFPPSPSPPPSSPHDPGTCPRTQPLPAAAGYFVSIIPFLVLSPDSIATSCGVYRTWSFRSVRPPGQAKGRPLRKWSSCLSPNFPINSFRLVGVRHRGSRRLTSPVSTLAARPQTVTLNPYAMSGRR